MQSDAVEPFPDNWAYLKAELTWLDRVLSLAIARQRQDTKDIDRVARSRADRATSHWWKGLVTLEGETAYDSPAENPRRRVATAKASYQQQLEAKIQVNQQRGIPLGLPLLCSRLQLSVAEKNLVLMALAPEISRRYGRLYNYLQESEQSGAAGLPTVELILRLLCRTDAEWRSLRQRLTDQSALLRYGLLELQPAQTKPLLTRLVKLSDPLVNYLLAEQPHAIALEALLQPASSPPVLSVCPASSRNLWFDLVLPTAVVTELQHLCHRVQFAHQVDENWGFQPSETAPVTGSIALLSGVSGTGKMLAARAIAQTLQLPLFYADLALLNAAELSQLLQAIVVQSPTLLLLKAAQQCFGRNTPLSNAAIHQFLASRQQQGLTLLSVQRQQSVMLQWRRQLTAIVEFPLPDQASRLTLWQQAFPPSVPLDPAIDWVWLAHQFALSGSEISAIARDAAIDAAALAATVSMLHIIHASERMRAKRKKEGLKAKG